MNWLVLKDHPKVKYLFATNQSDDPNAFDEAYKALTAAVNEHNKTSKIGISADAFVLRDHMLRGRIVHTAETGNRSFVDLFFHLYPKHAVAFREACDMAKLAHESGDATGAQEALDLAHTVLICAWAQAYTNVPRSTDPVKWWESDQ